MIGTAVDTFDSAGNRIQMNIVITYRFFTILFKFIALRNKFY